MRDITSFSSQDPNSQALPTSQLALPTEEGEGESDVSETDELIAGLPDPPLWIGGQEGAGGGGAGEGGGGGGAAGGGGRGGGRAGGGGGGERDRDFVSVSELHYTQDDSEEVSGAKRRKHCCYTDHEM